MCKYSRNGTYNAIHLQVTSKTTYTSGLGKRKPGVIDHQRLSVFSVYVEPRTWSFGVRDATNDKDIRSGPCQASTGPAPAYSIACLFNTNAISVPEKNGHRLE